MRRCAPIIFPLADTSEEVRAEFLCIGEEVYEVRLTTREVVFLLFTSLSCDLPQDDVPWIQCLLSPLVFRLYGLGEVEGRKVRAPGRWCV